MSICFCKGCPGLSSNYQGSRHTRLLTSASAASFPGLPSLNNPRRFICHIWCFGGSHFCDSSLHVSILGAFTSSPSGLCHHYSRLRPSLKCSISLNYSSLPVVSLLQSKSHTLDSSRELSTPISLGGVVSPHCMDYGGTLSQNTPSFQQAHALYSRTSWTLPGTRLRTEDRSEVLILTGLWGRCL